MTTAQLARDARFKYIDFPKEKAVISDAEYDCIRLTSTGRRRPLEIGGFQDEPEVIIAISNFDPETGERVFPIIPTVGTSVLLAGETYRIDRIEESAYGNDVVMELRTPNK